MDTSPQSTNPSLAAWGVLLAAAVCERCDWQFLLPATTSLERCPHCFQGRLSPLDEQIANLPYIAPPEMSVPFQLSAGQLDQAVQGFAQGIPFRPADLNPQALRSRLRQVYLPMWLVDADVKATWRAETGFNYRVVSHQDQYSGSGWSSRKVEEQRVRWEPRLGRLARRYQNVAAPALEEHQQLKQALGKFDLSAARPYQANGIGQQAFFRLPDRPQEDAWSEARLALQNAAAEECRQAARADHLRQFTWQPEFQNQNWTLLLLPLYTSFYLDDEQQPQAVWIQGQSGQTTGQRRSSMKRAQRLTFILLGVALLFFVLGLALLAASVVAPPALIFGIIGMALALAFGLGSLAPVLTAWSFNQGQKKPG